ncbi:hypothetical protein CTAYLR_009321 [Chrysophaeum taylorii]|uniref:Uncharacterized protein n=1 Tax=Chrysophaeum taylorii TaxID=2483200 RepID=A0AAD7UI49_9STRA|nr:hypothetical protein CTAYLR_009321 [Chrysophaeum taylorii]
MRFFRAILLNTPSAAAALVINSAAKMAIVVDPFCLRQFDPASGKTPFIPMSVAEFEAKVNELYDDDNKLTDGYAPFCKHLFVPNFAGCESNVVAITAENEHLLRSGYVARTDAELPVLERWFPKTEFPTTPKAKFLDLILYSRDQINKENEAMGASPNPATAPWGIVSVKAQDVDSELPMTPITVMRNALGKDQGGSGVPLDPAAYRASVAYWKAHAPLR